MPFRHATRHDGGMVTLAETQPFKRLAKFRGCSCEVAEGHITAIFPVCVKADQRRLVGLRCAVVDDVEGEVEISGDLLPKPFAGGFIFRGPRR